MSMYITLISPTGTMALPAQRDAFIAPLLREHGLLPLPCGVGKCGKCLIYANTTPSEQEQALLGKDALAAGLRLACYTKAVPGLVVRVFHGRALHVLTTFVQRPYVFCSLVQRAFVSLPEPSLDDQRSDVQRLLEASAAHDHALSIEQMRALPAFMREHRQCYVLKQANTLLGFTTEQKSIALIIDIGTTTVAALLVDLTTQHVLFTHGQANRQAPYGADVISRINQQMHVKPSQPDPLQQAIIQQLCEMFAYIQREVGFEQVDCVAITGNTTMLHFLCGLPAEHLSKAPFIPVSLEAMRVHATDLGLPSDAPTYLLPGISAYIGADIIASLLAADAHHPQAPFILVDLGTNAEIVLGVGGRLYACSAAAGPCFEGATLSCGMAGQAGAIDSVGLNAAGELVFSTIEGAPAKGLCGSGVLDAVALLLDVGLVDETGRLEADNSLLGQRVYDDALHLTEHVCLTQKDIREVQLAKAAVRAGIDILLQTAGLTDADIACLYLAGGFGSAMKPHSAARIGLIPERLAAHVCVLGNAASFGALRYVTEPEACNAAQQLVTQTQYLELSAHAGFTNAYVERMIFPEHP